MSIKGGAYPRFRRALEHGNPLVVRAAASELEGGLSLADALAVTLVLLADSRERYDRAAARWTARLSLETPGVALVDVQLAGVALQQLAGGGLGPGVAALRGLLTRLGLARCLRELAEWEARHTPASSVPEATDRARWRS